MGNDCQKSREVWCDCLGEQGASEFEGNVVSSIVSRELDCEVFSAVSGQGTCPLQLMRIRAQDCRRRKFPSGGIRNPRTRGFKLRA